MGFSEDRIKWLGLVMPWLGHRPAANNGETQYWKFEVSLVGQQTVGKVLCDSSFCDLLCFTTCWDMPKCQHTRRTCTARDSRAPADACLSLSFAFYTMLLENCNMCFCSLCAEPSVSCRKCDHGAWGPANNPVSQAWCLSFLVV
jgi:hypothetical protein